MTVAIEAIRLIFPAAATGARMAIPTPSLAPVTSAVVPSSPRSIRPPGGTGLRRRPQCHGRRGPPGKGARPFAARGIPIPPNRNPWIDVFGRNSNNAIYHFYWRGGAWGYYSMGGTAGGPPAAVAPSPDRAMVGVIWSDGSFRWRYWDGSAWSPWASLGGPFLRTAAPVLVASGWNTIHAFVKNTNNSISYRRFNNGIWTPSWENLGGTAAVGPISAASWNVNRVDVVRRGPDNKLWRRTWNGSYFGAWVADTGAELVSAPTIISTRPDRLDVVYYRNTGGTVVYRRRHWDGSAWSVDDPTAVAGISTAIPPSRPPGRTARSPSTTRRATARCGSAKGARTSASVSWGRRFTVPTGARPRADGRERPRTIPKGWTQ